jgi:hypothetical protein
MYDFVLDRIAILSDFATRNCCEPSCGTRDEDGDVVSCTSAHCGERRIDDHHQRELQCMRDMRALIEWLERDEIAKAAAADKAAKGRKK